MKSLLSIILCGAIVCFSGGIRSSAEINGSVPFSLIEYCETHEIQSEEELQGVLDSYLGEDNDSNSHEIGTSDAIVSFDLYIDYEDQYVITTTVYECETARGSKSGYAVQRYRNDLGLLIFEIRVDGTFSYNGSTCSTTSTSATFTPVALLGWSSSPTVASGKSGNQAYARAYGTASNGFNSQTYSVVLYCDANGNLSP